MEGYTAFRRDPAGVGEVRLIDHQGIAVPTAHGVAPIGRRHSVPMRPSVGGDDLKAVIGFRQHDHELRRLHDLPHRAHIEEAHVQSSKRRVYASQ